MQLRQLAALILLAAPLAARAQTRALNAIGSVEEDRQRLAQISDSASTAGFLIRSARIRNSDDVKSHAFAIRPEVAFTWNSKIPFSLDDGAMWAGRGASYLIRAGVGYSTKLFSAVFAPEFTYSQNLDFQTMPGAAPGRNVWSSPWHTGNASADLPLRFGNQSLSHATLGQSSLTLHAGVLDLGASTENQWWGPGIRNALLLSNQAEGMPHLFLRSARPVTTGVGDFEWRIIGGALSESAFFDTVSSNNTRSLSGFILTLRPAVAPHLTVGIARIVVAPSSGVRTLVKGAFNSLTQWHTENIPVTRNDSLRGDQMTSLFGRWIFPKDHFELYFEWAKGALPRSLRDLVIAPQDAQGYTLGLQWALPLRDNATLRFQGEASDVEQSTVFADHPIRDFYTGSTAAQGFTQRGQLLGASFGPGGQSQWLAADYMKNNWSLGVMLQRIRWEDNAAYRLAKPDYFRHDVTLLAGIRATRRTRTYDLSASLSANPRQAYLFQNDFSGAPGIPTVDIRNFTFTLGLAPR